MQRHHNGGNPIRVQVESLVTNEKLLKEGNNGKESVALTIELVEKVGEFNCSLSEWVVSGLEVGGVDYVVCHDHRLVWYVDVAGGELEYTEIQVWVGEARVPLHYRQSQGKQGGTDEDHLQEGEEGADLGIKDVPAGVNLVDTRDKRIFCFISADQGVETPLLRWLHENTQNHPKDA